MTAALKKQFHHRAGTRGVWQRGNLATWRAGRERVRATWDEERIVLLRAAMQESATAKAALDWADRVGLEIIIDHTVKAGGYYWPGSGVVAVTARQVKSDDYMAQAVNTLTHEIRHAWQDFYGLIYLPMGAQGVNSPLGRDLAIEAIYEADAYAHGKLAEAEYNYNRTHERVLMLRAEQAKNPHDSRARLLRNFERAARGEHAACADAAQVLWQQFQAWYAATPFGLARFYGVHHRADTAHALGLGQVAEDYRFEYTPPQGIALAQPPDFSQRAVLDQLGRSFSGVNYLAQQPVRDHIMRTLWPPGAAERYFPRKQAASKRKPDKLTRKIRATQLKQRLGRVRPAKDTP